MNKQRMYLFTSKFYQESIGYKLDVLRHEGDIHTDQPYGYGFAEEFLLDGDRIADDLYDPIL